ncbi:MAG: hypothetical protein VYA34_11085 [Myxococcota bacterium]|nr:hypothetical protein [Myxococcota bacterium]
MSETMQAMLNKIVASSNTKLDVQIGPKPNQPGVTQILLNGNEALYTNNNEHIRAYLQGLLHGLQLNMRQ